MKNCKSKITKVFLFAVGLLFTVAPAHAQFCTFTKQDVDCLGESTGIISFNPSGGTPPYSYAWSHNSLLNTNEAFDLEAGFYTITVTDAVNTSELCFVGIFEPPTGITITNVVEVDPMCGFMDGSLEITAVPQSGGSASDLMYSIDGGVTFQTSNLFTGLSADDYLIIVADVNGCFLVESRQLVSASNVFIDLNSAMCDPAGTISIDITAGGGTSPYTYAWSDNSSSEDLIGADPGSYMVTVLDREGCEALSVFAVEECCDSSMFCDGTIASTSCVGGSDGEISVSPVGGNGPYTYSWSHDALETSNIASNLVAGFYNVTVADSQACETVCGFDVLDAIALAINSVDAIDATCGEANGSISINSTPSSLSYSIDNGLNFQSSNLFTNLNPGTYEILVADMNDCVETQIITILNSEDLNIDIVDAFCDTGVSINIGVQGSGGLAPYSYAWSGETGFTNPTPNTVTGAPGTYMVTVTDANGCASEETIILNSCCGSGMFCETVVANVTCNGDSNGSIEVTPNGGTAPFNYSWAHEPQNSTNISNGLTAGFYSLTVTDSAGCSSMCGIEVTEPSSILINNITTVNPSCGLNVGSITIYATMKSGQACNDLEYSIDGGMNYQTTNSFVNLPSGDYMVIARDCDNCMSVQEVEMLDGTGLNLGLSTDCANGLVDVDLNVMDGIGPFRYAWEGPSGFISNDEDLVGVSAGTYAVTVQDVDGCEATAMITENMCCNLDATCPPDIVDIACANFPDIPAEFLNINPVGDAAAFSAIGGSIAAFPGPCADVTIYASDNLTGAGCMGDPYVLERTFTITDGVGTIECSMTMTGGDFDFPVIENEAINLELDCPDDINIAFNDWLANNAGATATDDCAAVVWTNNAPIDNIEFDTDYSVDFIASDDCGNMIETTGNFRANSCPELGNVAGKVWEDLNGNGVYDEGETFLEGVPVSLFASFGVLRSTAFTNAEGEYLFEDVANGSYIVHFGVPSEYTFTLPNVGSNSTDSDVDESNGAGTTAVFSLSSNNRRFDAGVFQCIPVGKLIWYDVNMNDQKDPAENGINGMQVKAWKQDSNGEFYEFDDTTTGESPDLSSDDGYYLFCLPPGSYYLEYLIPPFGLVPVLPGVGSEETDSDITGDNGSNTTSTFIIESGEMRCDIAAGYYPMASICNSVFFDGNSNGLFDTDESGMQDVTLELYDANSNELIKTVVTDIEGVYLFDYLGKDDYYIRVLPPTNYLITIAHVGDDESMDSDVDNSNGPFTTAMYTLAPGMKLNDVNIGLRSGATVDVDWININGENKGSYNEIHWTVSSQNNSSHYEIERKTKSANSFISIGKSGVESSLSTQKYSYKDYDTKNFNLGYYRIAEYDVNGNVSYSEMIVIETKQTEQVKVNIAPNPFVSELVIEIDSPSESEASITFWTVGGSKIEMSGFDFGHLDAGLNSLSYDWSAMPSGVYSAHISIDGNRYIKKLIKIE